MKSRTEVRSMENEHSILVRRAVIFGVPFLYYVRRPGALNNVDLIAERPHAVHNTYLELLRPASWASGSSSP